MIAGRRARARLRALAPLPVGVCLVVALAAASSPAPARDLGSGPETGAEEQGFDGSLDLRLHPLEGRLEPPAEMVLTDPRGRRIGFDPRTGERWQEIPGSYYEPESIADDIEIEPGPSTSVLHIVSPLAGDYRLEIIGREQGGWALEAQALDRAMNPTRAEIGGAHLDAGEVARYRVRYSDAVGAVVEVEAMDLDGAP